VFFETGQQATIWKGEMTLRSVLEGMCKNRSDVDFSACVATSRLSQKQISLDDTLEAIREVEITFAPPLGFVLWQE